VFIIYLYTQFQISLAKNSTMTRSSLVCCWQSTVTVWFRAGGISNFDTGIRKLFITGYKIFLVIIKNTVPRWLPKIPYLDDYWGTIFSVITLSRKFISVPKSSTYNRTIILCLYGCIKIINNKSKYRVFLITTITKPVF